MTASTKSLSSFNVAKLIIRFLDEYGIVRYGLPVPKSGVGDAFPYRPQQPGTSTSDLMRERAVEFAYLLEEYDEGTLRKHGVPPDTMPQISAPQQKAAVLRRFGLPIWARPQRAWGTSDTLVPIRIKKLLAPIPTPPAIWSLGVNYRSQMAELGVDRSKYPVAFLQSPSAVNNPFDPVPIPPIAAGESDYEVELAVVIGVDTQGRLCKDVTPETAMDYVLGYTVANDIGARRWQGRKGGGQWSRAKSFDGFLPLGPALASPAAIPDPQNVRMTFRLNGQTMQDASTAEMIFPVREIVAFLSQGTTLLPGTVILSGTPAGVGFLRKPAVFLKSGDELCAQAEGIGCLYNPVLESK